MREPLICQDYIYEMVATSDSPSKTVSRITFLHKHYRWRCSHARINLKITLPSRHNRQHLCTRSHVWLVDVFHALGLVGQRKKGSAETPPSSSLFQVSTTNYLRLSFAKQLPWWSNRGGKRERTQVCVKRAPTPPYIGEGAAPKEWSATPWCAPTSPTIMWVEAPLTLIKVHQKIPLKKPFNWVDN
jgi:hypothetical protein